MKRKISTLLVLVAAILLNINAFSQRQCVAHDLRSPQQIAADELHTQQFIAEGKHLLKSTITIPVNVIVVYANSTQNISTAQIQSQIDQLNADYAATNNDLNPPAEFAGIGSGNTGIQFTLANIERHSNSTASWGTNNSVKTAYPPTTPTTMLNIWVCNIGGGILGYAQFPGGSASTDGLVISPQYFGSKNYGSGFYLSAPFDKGRTATHEVGHWVNLRHIWGDGACNADDFVDDTPRAAASNYGCPAYPTNSCTNYAGNDMTMNYMDYTDDACMYMFSAGQKARMLAIFDAGGSRASFGGGGTTPPGGGGGGTGTLTETCSSASSISISRRKWKYYSVTVPSGATALSVAISGGSGDADLYVRYGSNPTTSAYDCRPYLTGNAESCSFTNPTAGSWKIGVYAYAAVSGLNLNVCYTSPSGARISQMITDGGERIEDGQTEIYPNPATDVLNVALKMDEPTQASIYSISGALVKTVTVSAMHSTIQVNDLTPGIYTIKVNTDKGVFTERFMKQ